MKKNYIQPSTEVIYIEIENSVLQGSDTPNSSVSVDPFTEYYFD